MKTKIIIRNEAFPITDQELSGYMDFQHVLEKHKQPVSSFPLKSLAGLLVILAIGAAFFIWRTTSQNDIAGHRSTDEASAPPTDTVQVKIEDTPGAFPEEKGERDSEERETYPDPFTPKERNEMPVEEKIDTKQEKPIRATEPDARAVEATEQEMIFIKAEPQGGISRLYEYFDEHLTYPDQAADSLVSGQTLVTFSIFKDGKIGDIQIEKSLGNAFDKEVVRVLENMPPWNPATVNGQPVDSKISIPLYFTKP